MYALGSLGSSLSTSTSSSDNIVTPIMRRFAREQLKTTTAMTRSLHGDTGVYFIQGSLLILKLQAHPTFHILADRFFQQFGFHVPHYGCLSRESKVGALAFEKLQLVSTFFDKKIETSKSLSMKTNDIEELRSKFQWQLQRPFVTIMQKVEGTPFTKLDQDNIKLLFSNPFLLKNLGKMIFLDFFIGNRDRISPTGCNTGNFLLLAHYANAENPIAPIDHDYHLNSNKFSMLSKSMDTLLDKTILPQLIFQLKNQLEFGREKLNFNESLVVDCIYEGIIRTAFSLVEKFSNHQDLVHELLEIPSSFRDRLPSNSWPDSDSFFNMLAYVSTKINQPAVKSYHESLQPLQEMATQTSIDLPSNNRSIHPLDSLLYYIKQETFDHDDIQIIDLHIINKIEPSIRFIYECLKELRLRSCGQSNLSNIVHQLRIDLANHLEKCIYLLLHSEEIKPNSSLLFKTPHGQNIGRDPWIVSAAKKSANEEQLVAASLHVRNLLFASKEVSSIIPDKAEEFLIKLNEFNSTHLPQYLTLLENIDEKEKKRIADTFHNLQSLMEKNQQTEVLQQLSTIRKLLRHL